MHGCRSNVIQEPYGVASTTTSSEQNGRPKRSKMKFRTRQNVLDAKQQLCLWQRSRRACEQA